jgi:hypothetical protein
MSPVMKAPVQQAKSAALSTVEETSTAEMFFSSMIFSTPA